MRFWPTPPTRRDPGVEWWRCIVTGVVGVALVGASEWFPDLAVLGAVMLAVSVPLTAVALRAHRARRPRAGN